MEEAECKASKLRCKIEVLFQNLTGDLSIGLLGKDPLPSTELVELKSCFSSRIEF